MKLEFTERRLRNPILLWKASSDTLYWLYHTIKNRYMRYQFNKKGVDFYPELTSYHSKHSPLYIPTSFGILSSVLQTIPNISESGFFDLGCGKGNILYEASHFPFTHIGGVDIDPTLLSTCKHNMTLLSITTPMTLYNQSILSLSTELDSYHVFYCYAVLSHQHITDFCNILDDSHYRNPRDIILIFTNLDDPSIVTSHHFTLHLSKTPFSIKDFHTFVFIKKQPKSAYTRLRQN